MTMIKHTPGPWNVCERWPYQPDGLHINWDRLQNMWIIGVRPGVATAAAEREADARLVAAAPDLLAACLMAREELVFGGDWETAKRVIDTAIAKAQEVAVDR